MQKHLRPRVRDMWTHQVCIYFLNRSIVLKTIYSALFVWAFFPVRMLTQYSTFFLLTNVRWRKPLVGDWKKWMLYLEIRHFLSRNTVCQSTKSSCCRTRTSRG